MVLIVSVAGYSVGLFSASSGETITVTSSTTITEIQTITTASTSRITETVTSTINISGDLLIPSPANSSAIIRGRLLYDGTIFVTFSIDKPSYSIGEIVHIKSTITNLSPNNMSFQFESMIYVMNNIEAVWIYPEFMFTQGLGPLPMSQINLSSGETKILEEWMTADWNMIGLHYNSSGVYYDDYFVPEGQYTVLWPTDIGYDDSRTMHYESIEEEIPFTITKKID